RAQWQREVEVIKGSSKLKEELEALRQEETEAARRGDLNTAAEIKYGRIPELERKLALATEPAGGESSDESASRLLREEVTEEEIAQVVSRWTGIPVTKMLQSEVDKLLHMEDHLRHRVVGQDPAL